MKSQSHPTSKSQRTRDFSKGKFKGLFLPLVGFLETERQRRQRLRLGCRESCVPWPSTHPASIHVASSQNRKLWQSFTESLLCARRGLPPILGFSPRCPRGYRAHQKECTAGCWPPSNALGHNDHHSFLHLLHLTTKGHGPVRDVAVSAV